MKRLIAIAALGLALSFPSFSFASDYMELYTRPLVKSEVRGGNVEKDFTSFYTSQKTERPAFLITSDQNSDRYISIFGVQIPRNPGA